MSTPTLTSPYKVAPLRGGQIDNDTSFTGGIPVLDQNKVFNSTSTTCSGPPSFMAIRTQNVSNMIKVEMGAKAAPPTIFASATDASYGLMTYTGVVHRHLSEYGMDAIFYFPTHDGTLVNIIEGHSQFTREEVSKQSLELYKNKDDATKNLPLERYDMYDLQNLRFSAAFILASISPALRAQVLTKAGKDYGNGPIVWMYVMGLVQSSSYRGTKILQRTFEERKLKDEQGEDVIKHTIKLRDDYMRLFNANMVPYDVLMTVVDSLVDSSTPTFSVWAATKRIAVSRFLKDNAGKTPSALSNLPDAPTVENICDEADDEYQSLFESGLWVAINSKKDTEAAPTAFLLEELSTKINKLSADLTKREGTCWTCGKEGHKSPDCPTKNNNSPDDSKKKGKDRKSKTTTQESKPEWQRTAPKSGESESMVRNRRVWMWCDTCKHWSTTHGTSTHKGPDSPNGSNKTPKPQEKKEETQGNLAEIFENNNSHELEMGAWCGFITETTDTNEIPVCRLPVKSRNTTVISENTLDPWVTVISRSSKKKKNTATCNICQSLFLCTTPATDSTCHWCRRENTVVQILHETEHSITEPSDVAELEEKKFLDPVNISEDPPNDRDDHKTEIVPTITSPPIKNKSTLFCHLLQDRFFHFGLALPSGLTAHVTPMSDHAWQHSCRYLQSDPGLYYSGPTNDDDYFKVIWDTSAFEVITSCYIPRLNMISRDSQVY